MSDAEAKDDRGVPAWVMTFADLMTLLMCFFVLLLAFSEMDVAKFKQLSGSMKDAFGVQADVEARTIPKGTSIIAQEFSPGTPEATPTNQVRQNTVDSNKNTLDALSPEIAEVKAARRQARRLGEALAEEVRRGSVAIELKGARVTIRILERASFASASADVRPEFVPVIRKIARLLDADENTVTVAGHTDNLPISTARFRSNWDLSTARAVSVAHEIFEVADVDQAQFTVVGHADTKPLAPNDTPENRSKNRRVDISITRGGDVDARATDRINQAIAARNEGADPNE